MFLKFFPSESGLAETFGEEFPEELISMAQLQGHFMMYKDQPLEAYRNLLQLKEKSISQREERAKMEKNDEPDGKLEISPVTLLQGISKVN